MLRRRSKVHDFEACMAWAPRPHLVVWKHHGVHVLGHVVEQRLDVEVASPTQG